MAVYAQADNGFYVNWQIDIHFWWNDVEKW